MDDYGSGRPVLTREKILSGVIDEVARENLGSPVIPIDERLAIKRSMLNELGPEEDVWVFGYGSLIWNPAFHFDERRVVHLHGYRRCFSFWSVGGRGTPEKPGLMLALEPGGSCRGVGFRIRRDKALTELRSVFMREMVTGAYKARWVTVRCGGEKIRAITFVANPSHGNYAGVLPLETVADYLWNAGGWLGRGRDYLINTVDHLDELGIRDGSLARLRELVEQRIKENEGE